MVFRLSAFIFLCFVCYVQFYSYGVSSDTTFDRDFKITWGYDHATTFADGEGIQLQLDNSSGSSFASKNRFLFGSISTQIKLVAGDSAGVVTAYYMCSAISEVRDELDFEFLGNETGQPYILQTNVYTHGVGSREQRIYLWFDPTADFHSYTINWNHQQLIFLVDDIPIRVFGNHMDKGIHFPISQPMGIYSSIWNADEWATEGGLLKTNWTYAPFITYYQGFNMNDACEWTDTTTPAPACTLPTATNWWNEAPWTNLDTNLMRSLLFVKQNYMVYDYCTDAKRFQTLPPECSLNL